MRHQAKLTAQGPNPFHIITSQLSSRRIYTFGPERGEFSWKKRGADRTSRMFVCRNPRITSLGIDRDLHWPSTTTEALAFLYRLQHEHIVNCDVDLLCAFQRCSFAGCVLFCGIRTRTVKMNNQGIMSQEKMELDLDLPSSLVQSDGHLRRSNSEPMINGLRWRPIAYLVVFRPVKVLYWYIIECLSTWWAY